jgi:hypothetical protein
MILLNALLRKYDDNLCSVLALCGHVFVIIYTDNTIFDILVSNSNLLALFFEEENSNNGVWHRLSWATVKLKIGLCVCLE